MSMDIEIAYQDKMCQTGSALLRAIQNTSAPRLDLLIRESLQNCLDAGNGKDRNVIVEFSDGEVDTEAFADEFSSISQRLKKLYPGSHAFVAIRDSHTQGLTGPIRQPQDASVPHGNYLKLVEDIQQANTDKGAGGSWGIGKTVYFQIGIGLVIYYSRIYNTETGKYESRMAATLVEDEKGKKALLPGNTARLNRGIAWWGKTDPLGNGQSVIPVQNEEYIHGFLKLFNIQPYSGTETGTVILIPLVDRKTLLEATWPPEADEKRLPYWNRSLMDYLNISAQRWYAPRIENKRYEKRHPGGQYLSLVFNGVPLEKKNMEPTARLIQALYNSSPDDCGDFNEQPVQCDIVNLRAVFAEEADYKGQKMLAGTVSYLNATREMLKMLPPDNYRSPYEFLGIDERDDGTHPVVMAYTRKPGMIVEYTTADGWLNGVPETDTNEYLIGLFVPESRRQLKKQSEEIRTLEDYLRQGEKADHMRWEDSSVGTHKYTIVQNIKKNVAKILKKIEKEAPSEGEERRNTGLGYLVGQLVLPDISTGHFDAKTGGGKGLGGHGGDGTVPENGETEKGLSRRSKSSRVKYSDTFFEDGDVCIPVEFQFGKKPKLRLEMVIAAEGKNISPKDWAEDVGGKFPAEIVSFTAEKVEEKNGKKKLNLLSRPVQTQTKWKKTVSAGNVQIALEKDSWSGKRTVLTFAIKGENPCVLTGVIRCRMEDFAVEFRQKDEE